MIVWEVWEDSYGSILAIFQGQSFAHHSKWVIGQMSPSKISLRLDFFLFAYLMFVCISDLGIRRLSSQVCCLQVIHLFRSITNPLKMAIIFSFENIYCLSFCFEVTNQTQVKLFSLAAFKKFSLSLVSYSFIMIYLGMICLSRYDLSRYDSWLLSLQMMLLPYSHYFFLLEFWHIGLSCSVF